MVKHNRSEIASEFDRRIDDVIAITNALQLLTRPGIFRDWLATNTRIRNDQQCFDGLKFVFNTLIKRLQHELTMNASLGLTDDFIFNRANFTGVAISKLPNSCEKTIVLKNIDKSAQRVLDSRDWPQLESSMHQFENEILTPFIQLKSLALTNKRFTLTDMYQAITYATMFEIYIFLNDTRRGAPHGYLRMKYDDGTTRYLRKVFKGYKYVVQFLWFNLLGSDFKNSALAQIHRALDWNSFDMYFDVIRAEVIEPLEHRIGTLLGLVPLITIQQAAKSVLAPLILHIPSAPTLSPQEKLEQFFLWYEVELIDASQDTLFNGIPAFVTALLGSIEMKKRVKSSTNTEVIRLIHTEDSHRDYYSYAVLMEVGGLFSDSSGWLLFFDCCYNTGSGRQGLEFCERFISEFTKKGLINIREQRVSKKALLSLMKGYLISATKEEIFNMQNVTSRLQNISDRFDTSRGLLLEFIAFYMYSYLVDNIDAKIAWNYSRLNNQIDVLVRLKNKIVFIECTNYVDTLTEDSNRIKKKAELLCADPKFCTEWAINSLLPVELILFTWDPPPKNLINLILREGVEIIVLSDEINKHPHLVCKGRDKLRHVFERPQVKRSQR